jgi:hypothetical protein
MDLWGCFGTELDHSAYQWLLEPESPGSSKSNYNLPDPKLKSGPPSSLQDCMLYPTSSRNLKNILVVVQGPTVDPPPEADPPIQFNLECIQTHASWWPKQKRERLRDRDLGCMLISGYMSIHVHERVAVTVVH